MDDAAEARGTSLWQRVVNTCANSIRVFFSAELAFIYVLFTWEWERVGRPQRLPIEQKGDGSGPSSPIHGADMALPPIDGAFYADSERQIV